MSFNTVRKALDELDAVATNDKLITDVEKLQKKNQQLEQDNNQLRGELQTMMDENSRNLAKANIKEAEIQRRAQILTNNQVNRWHAEEKPRVIVSAVEEEIKSYPSNCTASTKRVIDAKAEQRLQEETREGWNAVLFPIFKGFKAANGQAATAGPETTDRSTVRVYADSKKIGIPLIYAREAETKKLTTDKQPTTIIGYLTNSELGLSFTSLIPEHREDMGIPEEIIGVLITEVRDGSPAQQAGIKGWDREVNRGSYRLSIGGDIVIEVNGVRTTTIQEFQGLLGSKPGIYNLKLYRNGSTIEVTIQSRK